MPHLAVWLFPDACQNKSYRLSCPDIGTAVVRCILSLQGKPGKSTASLPGVAKQENTFPADTFRTCRPVVAISALDNGVTAYPIQEGPISEPTQNCQRCSLRIKPFAYSFSVGNRRGRWDPIPSPTCEAPFRNGTELIRRIALGPDHELIILLRFSLRFNLSSLFLCIFAANSSYRSFSAFAACLSLMA